MTTTHKFPLQVVDITRTAAGVRRSNLKALRERELRETALRAEIEQLRLETTKVEFLASWINSKIEYLTKSIGVFGRKIISGCISTNRRDIRYPAKKAETHHAYSLVFRFLYYFLVDQPVGFLFFLRSGIKAL